MKKAGTIAMIIIGLLMLILASSCSAFRHIVPERDNLFVTKGNICQQQNVVIGYEQNIFASVIRFKYESSDDTLELKLFRVSSNSYSGEYKRRLYHVSFGIEQILKIEDGITTIIVDYICH